MVGADRIHGIVGPCAGVGDIAFASAPSTLIVQPRRSSIRVARQCETQLQLDDGLDDDTGVKKLAVALWIDWDDDKDLATATAG
ncbi:hypothetical protein E2562_036020 [Oryza meyeriana var. granulata]|uniref:Uncharacterized protein n=1 Tax=Oryza meyeriana var. granulata TaxID=110450 RepID=A0A6G1CX09_9ORYZ|nr:hypothetical protein E2562_036020 [Oryza meyeriana var. granulata]